MNVLDLDVYMDILYIVCAICRFCNSSYLVILYFVKKSIAQTYLLRPKRP
jgi:hypothetical protein